MPAAPPKVGSPAGQLAPVSCRHLFPRAVVSRGTQRAGLWTTASLQATAVVGGSRDKHSKRPDHGKEHRFLNKANIH
jgi:hypothetical protein